jgi:hypothetical protein
VTTASAACIQLARDLAGDTTDLLRLDMSFRPSIVIF